MKLIQKLTSPMMFVALAGALTTSVANAQFVFESEDPVVEVHEHKSGDSTHSTHTSHWMQEVKDGDHVYVLKLTDGVFDAQIDGKVIPSSQIINKGSVVVIVDKDGEKIYEFKAPKTKGIAVYPSRMGHEEHKNVQAFAWAPDDEDQSRNFRATVVKAEQPKVMLGINMSEPSAALRKHLKLGEDRQVIMVEKVIDGLPAAKSGMESYDIIISINGSEEADGQILHKELMKQGAGDTMKLVVLRSGEKLVLTPKLEAYDSEKLGTVTVTATFDEDEQDGAWYSHDGGKTTIRVEDGRSLAASDAAIARLQEQMMKRAEEAMSQAERQIVELRDGQLFVHKQKVEDLRNKLANRFQGLESDTNTFLEDRLHSSDRLAELEERFESLQGELDEQMERLEERMERLMSMMESLFERFEEDED